VAAAPRGERLPRPAERQPGERLALVPRRVPVRVAARVLLPRQVVGRPEAAVGKTRR